MHAAGLDRPGSPVHLMRASGTSHGIDRTIAALAERQYGVVSRAQLTALGVTRGHIQRRVGSGRLLRLHPGVYAVGHRAPRREALWLAAVLACGDGAVLSYRSAAVLWQSPIASSRGRK